MWYPYLRTYSVSEGVYTLPASNVSEGSYTLPHTAELTGVSAGGYPYL